jgi:hypothetical protein
MRFASYISVGSPQRRAGEPSHVTGIAQPSISVRGNLVNLDNLASHLQRDHYGAFWLTEAVRPGLELTVTPTEGYRTDTYEDERHDLRVPVLAAAVSRERLFDVFLSLLEPLGGVVDVVLETSHASKAGKHRDIHREHIDLPVLTSHLCDFEDLLLHDGCTGVAVISRDLPIEVQFDEHKVILVYAQDLTPFAEILDEAGIPRDDGLKVITEGTHLHNTDPRHQPAFEQLCYRLGVGEGVERVSW